MLAKLRGYVMRSNPDAILNFPKEIVLHCSASPDNRDDIDVHWIDRIHKRRGWRGVGYHYVVTRQGEIQIGRLESEVGAHVRGHNRNRIGVCWVGIDMPTQEQIASIFVLYRRFKDKYGLNYKNWKGHYEFTDPRTGDPVKKTCPNIDMDKFREQLKELG